jgi:hypothetical protein
MAEIRKCQESPKFRNKSEHTSRKRQMTQTPSQPKLVCPPSSNFLSLFLNCIVAVLAFSGLLRLSECHSVKAENVKIITTNENKKIIEFKVQRDKQVGPQALTSYFITDNIFVTKFCQYFDLLPEKVRNHIYDASFSQLTPLVRLEVSGVECKNPERLANKTSEFTHSRQCPEKSPNSSISRTLTNSHFTAFDAAQQQHSQKRASTYYKYNKLVHGLLAPLLKAMYPPQSAKNST